ncbi:cyclopropane-fatty-acyl-phospholipid synthase family protein [Ensifer sp.]|jgi:cyclopropane-fatty-acyl-phospholipid synthase|uniref:cyclopropane-fatty-acyl-phospholipid synthase family protein n=1 Tax=Ensifer sp. TaxID=1872086 RepID=UPI002E0E20E2|nr:cyclopropane-fatty-acyl-phospholipid synthase family protein [Ensifer sp.]
MRDQEAEFAAFDGAVTLSTANLAMVLRDFPPKARRILGALVHLQVGSLMLATPDGRKLVINGARAGPRAILTLHNWSLPQRAIAGGTIGAAESYIDGDWDSPDVGAFLELFLVNAEIGRNFPNRARGLLRLIDRFLHWRNANTRSGARRNISAHYDLGNAFYSEWLDPSMTYSSALYATGANDLRSAQRAKYRALADATNLRAGDHVLEIGCGWGGFAEFAASEIGCKVTGLTISREQLAFARERMRRAGLSEKVELKLQDYREERGIYDRIVSIEMFEAVGERFWGTYFSQLKKCLKPGGKAGLQIITIKPEAYEEYRSNPDFIQKYVFPGGMLPTREHLVDLGRNVGLRMINDFGFGIDYARTLGEWRERFWSVWSRIEPLGFDLRFKRLWEFYFYYCEAGFRSRNIDVRQIVFE